MIGRDVTAHEYVHNAKKAEERTCAAYHRRGAEREAAGVAWQRPEPRIAAEREVDR